MATFTHHEHSLTDSLSSSSSSQSFFQTSPSRRALSMKDVSNSVRITRPSAYPKKKPSPYGVSKSRKQLSQQHQRQPQTPLHPAQAVVRKSPRGAKAQEALQRQRETHIHTLRREGIYLEEEYRDEIQEYMHAMEVSCPYAASRNLSAYLARTTASATPCRLSHPWTNSPR